MTAAPLDAPQDPPLDTPLDTPLGTCLGTIEALRAEVRARQRGSATLRWNAAPEDVQRSLARLVLALVEFLRKLMERQAIRRMEAETLSSAEVESVGRALMLLENTVRELAERFGLRPEDLNIDLGPLGRLV
jgi:hypothetical protein